MASSPDCGKPYMPRWVTIYTAPFASVFSFSLYSFIISSGMSRWYCPSFYCSGAVGYCGYHFDSICDGGSGEPFVVEVYGVCETFDGGGFYVVSMCSIVLY